MKKIISFILCFVFALTFVSCAASENPDTDTTTEENISQEITSEEAVASGEIYTEDTTIGEGETTIYVSVITEDKTVKITINTDKEILGEALIDCGLVEGEEGPYGLYIEKVNGISAVYEKDKAYWALSENGVTSLSGADGITVSDGAQYELTYTKA